MTSANAPTLPLEPETEDPRNAMLDMAERAIEMVRDQGLTHELRARFDRIMPEDATGDTAPTSFTPEQLAQISTALRIVANRRMPDADRQAVDRARDMVAKALLAANKRRAA